MKKMALLLSIVVLFVLPAWGAVTTEYLGDDVAVWGTTIQGSWKANGIGQDGYHLLNWGNNEDQKSYPSYLDVATRSGFASYQWVAPGGTTEARAIQNAEMTLRAVPCWHGNGTCYIRIQMKQARTFILGVYMFDWESGRAAEVGVCSSTEEAAPPWKVTADPYNQGKWVFARVTGAAGDTVTVRTNALANNATISMLSFDPAGTAVAQFALADQTTGYAVYTNETTVSVQLVGAPAMGRTIVGYLITETPDTPAAGDGRWQPTSPTTYTFSQPTGNVTLYAWVKDDADSVAGKTCSITYNNAVPVLSNIRIWATDATIAVASWNTDIPAVCRARYRGLGDADWINTAWGTAPATSHLRALTGLVLDQEYEVIIDADAVSSDVQSYVHANPVSEIGPKSGWVADAYKSPYAGNPPGLGINGVTDDYWQTDVSPCWFRVDLGARYRIQRMGYQPRADHAFKNYEIYVTDVKAGNTSPTAINKPAEWGAPVATGVIPSVGTRTNIDFVGGSGRYLVLYGDRWTNGPTVSELWLYGDRLSPVIDSFVVSDRTSSAPGFTKGALVNVELTAHPSGAEIAGYMVTQSSTPPAAGADGWSTDPVTSYTITATPPTTVKLYGWVKNADGDVIGKPYSVYFSTATTVISGINIYATDSAVAVAMWNTSVPAVGRVRYRVAGDVEWTATALEAAPSTSHWRILSSLSSGQEYEVVIDSNDASSTIQTYVHENPVSEIGPKSGWVADAYETVSGNSPSLGINGATGDYWQTGVAPCWFRVDLGARYRIQRLGYQPRVADHAFNNYEIYVTDSKAGNISPTAINKPAEWGAPVATGVMPYVSGRTNIDLLGFGRYVVLYGDRYVNGPTVAELWLYGTLMPSIGVTAFSAADQSTGSALFTNTSTVNVTIAAEGDDIAGYLITETSDKPATDAEGWTAIPPAIATLSGEGQKTLYAWVKDSSGTVGESASATILFSTAVPIVSNAKIVAGAEEGSAVATWTTDLPAEGGVQFGPVLMTGGMPNTVLENAIGTEHSVTFATAADVNYKIVLVSNEVADAPFYWPEPWPIDGDANMDCRVNILDLIFIRNKLNQAVATGDNWKADVNEDTRINILDLIFVRNKLNTQCP
ncbi:MAG TPA: dockerin type I domain-containing protein [Phycisphaerae bacterium]|nr:dockerin type I domain-containing protein [Phycisphaerae bacterium]